MPSSENNYIINPSWFEAAIFHKSTKPARNSWCHMPATDWLTPMQRGDGCIKNRTIPIWGDVAATCCIWRHVAAMHMLHETITLQRGFMQRRCIVAATALHCCGDGVASCNPAVKVLCCLTLRPDKSCKICTVKPINVVDFSWSTLFIHWRMTYRLRRTGRGVRGRQLTPQFGQIWHLFGQKTKHLFVTIRAKLGLTPQMDVGPYADAYRPVCSQMYSDGMPWSVSIWQGNCQYSTSVFCTRCSLHLCHFPSYRWYILSHSLVNLLHLFADHNYLEVHAAQKM